MLMTHWFTCIRFSHEDRQRHGDATVQLCAVQVRLVGGGSGGSGYMSQSVSSWSPTGEGQLHRLQRCTRIPLVFLKTFLYFYTVLSLPGKTVIISYPSLYVIAKYVLFEWSAEVENSERALDNASAQHLRVKERQRFHKEVYQHDMDNYPPSAHLWIDCKKREWPRIAPKCEPSKQQGNVTCSRLHVLPAAPMGSISSMEVNVDVLEQMDLMDISDQEALDVFLNSGSGVDDSLTSPIPGEPTCVRVKNKTK